MSASCSSPPRPPHPASTRQHVEARDPGCTKQAIVRALAHQIARTYNLNRVFDELLLFGDQGFEEAWSRYDPSRQVSFCTFAWYRIRGAMLDGCRAMGWLKRKKEGQSPASDVRWRLTESTRHFPELGYAVKLPPTPSGSFDIIDCSPTHANPELEVQQGQRRRLVREAVTRLPERERTIVLRSYWKGETLDSIASDLGISRSWACRIRSRALRRLARALHPRLDENSPHAARTPA